ncbi:phage tail sheath C-terminal domain-containing protein [Limnoraphis robusta Tam1]|uniref:Phage tail sheath C-terminal domain-containing protein n=1 Tax=Limnoraphis robusta CCNP1315 TaxID=3110306 RepID=A0ABU5TZ15_9CYAN|nr:phage tail sheath C-terminal domain-containing protein [Limnoraphis robusta]MEA5519975.1 phage tail sheath C-terminal domain-containing protein [Limnoraphis robusta CCNP1315]MEA5540753.1 phage tail sheath C-terminal domain-containing protein [Limnoraphis robusta Tam1]MEA5544919.1 phage tail sheath C-terminal domain-containing protein [Limnoraphis robusta CCNP1324]
MARLDYFAPGVYVEEIERGSRPIQGVTMNVAGFVGFTEDVRGDAQLFEPQLITDWDQYLECFGKPGSDGFTDFGAYLPFAVRGWFDNGGGRCWVVSIGTQLPQPARQTPQVEENTTITAITTVSQRPSLGFRMKPDQLENGRINVIIEPDDPLPSDNPEEEPFDTGEYFKVTLRQGEDILSTYRHLSMSAEPEAGTFVETAFQESPYLEVEIQATSGMPLSCRPANGFYEIIPPPEVYPVDQLYRKTYGGRKDRTGIQGLFEIDEIAIIACPDLMLAYQQGLLNLEQLHGLMEMMMTNCENSAPSPPFRMVVLDPPPVKVRRGNSPVPPEQSKPQDVAEWLDNFGRRSQFAALYYPWIKVPNPRDNGKGIYVPPCGHMMGIWCQTDETRGVYKAPANVTPRGVISLAYDTNFREQELLNPKGINCIRKFPNRGLQVWGARTLVEPDNTLWRYISVRRLMSYIEKSIELGTQWVVFEPNDQDLWARVERTVNNFLERIWREGALFGSSPQEAFYVKCDGELNPEETMRLGMLYIEVGVRPVRPAEFVVFRVSQWAPNQ